ncbi:MAG TPA: YXWGXW repeat-containing protein [Polyangiaceae bacterium]|nr:YXWGXW repeat-containing protein [Polyangiaceae bacterium]
MTRSALCAVWMTLLSGCVIGRATRPTGSESARGPLAVPVTGGPIAPQTAPANDEAPAEKGKPGATWVPGYWHWDGVRYVWQRGRFEDDVPASGATAQ